MHKGAQRQLREDGKRQAPLPFSSETPRRNRCNETPPGGCAARCGVLLVLVVTLSVALCGSLCGVFRAGSVFI